ncbi:hypothetical protein GCM10010345_88360 [Streptomyces canarius]|uniref:Uncharacterized protein n=1 Tax=Streptomyces canarius TaxID=285453 RepID=A0ABQ3DBP2_9ACTN|nr:hypothetical protein GCM10010345_88360 [Streptomyces canarius]
MIQTAGTLYVRYDKADGCGGEAESGKSGAAHETSRCVRGESQALSSERVTPCRPGSRVAGRRMCGSVERRPG